MEINQAGILNNYFKKTTKAAPLAVFRIFFGTLMTVSIIRFWYNGWIEKLYLDPDFHFHFYGFDWVQVPPEWLCYLLFVICALSAFSFALGFKYKLSIITFFLSFTYIELMDKTTYLNHYYFVSLVSFILIWLPADHYYSIDAYRSPNKITQFIPKWNVDVIKLMLSTVYIYAGIAKLNSDWLFNAMPLAIWLPTKFEVPLLGDYMHQKWMHYGFSWAGAIYDLTIPFFLMWRKTRLPAFAAVVFFHVVTRVLFPIGMFPYIMIFSTLIFFDSSLHERILNVISKVISVSKSVFDNGISLQYHQSVFGRIAPIVLGVFMFFQIIIPNRFLFYPGDLFWTEQGFRFSWRVMLIEKTGYANFKIVDGKTGKRFYVQNEDFLTPFQQKQMATQADFIIEYAHFLGNHFENQGHENVEVYVESYAALNGRKSQPFIDPNCNLMNVENNLKNRTYIIPLYE